MGALWGDLHVLLCTEMSGQGIRWGITQSAIQHVGESSVMILSPSQMGTTHPAHAGYWVQNTVISLVHLQSLAVKFWWRHQNYYAICTFPNLFMLIAKEKCTSGLTNHIIQFCEVQISACHIPCRLLTKWFSKLKIQLLNSVCKL
jgi:hypothetical protein